MKLIYVGDPMCSWCYGFAPELDKVVDHYKEELSLELVIGGLRPYFTDSMSSMKDYLVHHWEQVGKASGQKFKYDILDRDDLNYDTEPPARAVVCVREIAGEKELTFYDKVQAAFYADNLELHKVESYHSILKELEIDVEEFNTLFQSEEMKEKVKGDFQKARNLGVRGFPSLLISTEDGRSPLVLSRGYAKHAQLVERIDVILDK